MYFGRGKNKIQNPYTIQDIYKEYIKSIDKDSVYDIPYQQYKNVCVAYYKKVMDYLFDTSLSFKLPHNLGTFQITKKKIKAKNIKKLVNSIDWENTVKYGKQIFHTNEHSGGYRYLFTWDRYPSKMRNIYKYRFVPTRANKRKSAYYIKNKVRDYFDKSKI